MAVPRLTEGQLCRREGKSCTCGWCCMRSWVGRMLYFRYCFCTCSHWHRTWCGCTCVGLGSARFEGMCTNAWCLLDCRHNTAQAPATRAVLSCRTVAAMLTRAAAGAATVPRPTREMLQRPAGHALRERNQIASAAACCFACHLPSWFACVGGAGVGCGDGWAV